MKKQLKTFLMTAGVILLVLFSFYSWYTYETRLKITFIDRVESPDGRTAVIFQMRGEPKKSFVDMSAYPAFTEGRFLVERDGESIQIEDFTVNNWGKVLTEENWEVDFYPAGVEVILKDAGFQQAMGDVLEDWMKEGKHIIVYYNAPDIYISEEIDGEIKFQGYKDEILIEEIMNRYDDAVSYLRKEEGKYYFQADGFEFSVTNDFRMTDNYEEAYFGYLAQQFSYDHNRYTELVKNEEENGKANYVPVVSFNGRQPGRWNLFANACCDLVETLQETVGFQKIGYFSEEKRRYFDITTYLGNYDRTALYNALYQSMESDSLEAWQYDESEEPESGSETDTGAPAMEDTAELLEYWRDYEADCSYQKKDGKELRMVGVDRAAGSSYYVLLEAENERSVNTAVINTDPYLGFGGAAKWLDFLEDEQIGFSCLAYNGGSYGSLYRTQDGGKHFEEITYPSAEAKLPDGSLYNPFVMPEKVWEEDGKLYMLVSQGPEGDYYEDGVWVYGVYESEDFGKSWKFAGTTEGEDYREKW